MTAVPISQRGHDMTTHTKVLLSTAMAAAALALLVGAPVRHREQGERLQTSGDQTESFIVQHEDMDSARRAVEHVGGKITHELSIINAVGADLTLGQLGELRQIRGLRIYENRELTFASTQEATPPEQPTGPEASEQDLLSIAQAPLMVVKNTVSSFQIRDVASAFGGDMTGVLTARDAFQGSSFSNDDGTTLFKGPWAESDNAGAGPFAGNIQVAGGAAVFQVPFDGSEPRLQRGLDLENAGTAILQLSFHTSLGVLPTDVVYVEMSSNEGAAFTIIDTLTGFAGLATGSRTYNVSGFASPH